MSLSPWDLSGNISFDFSLYRPRRPSYVYATQITRRRNESYRSATKTESTDEGGFDFIEDIVKRRDVTVGGADGGGGAPPYDSVSDTIDNRSEYSLRQQTPPARGGSSNHVAANGRNDRRRRRHNSTPIAIIEGSEDDCRVTITITEPSIDLDYDAADEEYYYEDDDVMENSFDVQERKSMAPSERDIACARQAATSARGSLSAFKSGSQFTLREGSKWRCIKNLLILSLSFILVFSAFRSIQNLQTSLNSASNLGFITMGCVHGTMFLTCLFTPVLINKLTSKWTIVLGLLFYLFWVAANFYPNFYTLIPTSIGVGFGQSLAWGAQVTYLQKLAVDYAHLSKELSQQELAKFNGIFLACFQTTHVWGNLVSSLMLADNTGGGLNNNGESNGAERSPPSAPACGVYDACSEPNNRYIDLDHDLPEYPPIDLMDNNSLAMPLLEENFTYYSEPRSELKLMGAYLVFAFIGFLLILLFLEKIGAKVDPEKTCMQMVWLNVQQLVKHKTYRLLTPLLLFNGFEQGFVYADYNKSYISCTVGVEFVGYNMITLGISNIVFSILIGVVVKHITREAIIGIGSVLHLSLLVFLLVWIPDANLFPVFFVISALWGMCDAVWQTQCNSLVNASCHDEHDIAFQNFRMLQGLGATIAFSLGSVICVEVKLYIIISLLILAITCYVVAEYRIRREEEELMTAVAAGIVSPATNRLPNSANNTLQMAD